MSPFSYFYSKILFSWNFYHPQVEQLPEEQEEQELELAEEEFPPQHNPKPLKILLIFLLLHFTQDIFLSSISLIVALTSKVLWQS